MKERTVDASNTDGHIGVSISHNKAFETVLKRIHNIVYASS